MKTFTKQSLTKRFLAIILSLVFALSSFTIAGFVPTMDTQAAETGTLTLNKMSYSVLAYSNPTSRINTSNKRINIVNDNGTGSMSCAAWVFDMKSIPDGYVLKSAAMTVNAVAWYNNNMSNMGVNFYIKNNDQTYRYTGGDYTRDWGYGSSGLSNYMSNLGITNDNLVGTKDHNYNTETSKTFDITDKVSAMYSGNVSYFTVYGMQKTPNTNGNTWSDSWFEIPTITITYEKKDISENLVGQWLVDENDVTAPTKSDITLTKNGSVNWAKANGIHAPYFNGTSSLTANISSILNNISLTSSTTNTSDGITISYATNSADTKDSSYFSFSKNDPLTTNSDVIGNRVISHGPNSTARISCNSSADWNTFCTATGAKDNDTWDYWSISITKDQEAKIYKNGSLVGTFAAGAGQTGGGLAVIAQDMFHGATNSCSTLGLGVTPLSSNNYVGYMRDFRIYNVGFDATDVNTVYEDMKAAAESTRTVTEKEVESTIFDVKNTTATPFTNSNGNQDIFSFTDTTTNVQLKGIQWSSTKEWNKTDGFIKIDNATLSTPSDFTAVAGTHYSVSMKYYWDGTTDSKSSSETVYGLGNGTTADLLFVKRGGSVYVCGTKATTISNDDIKCTNDIPKVMKLEYNNGVAKLYIDGVEKMSYNVPDNMKSRFESGVKNFFVGTSARNYAGGSWSASSGDTNSGSGASAIRNFKFYNLSSVSVQTVYDNETTKAGGRDPIPDPTVPEKITYTSVDVSALKTAIDSYESTFAAKVNDSTSALAGLAAGYKTYMKAKSYYDACKYGQESNTITADQITNITNDLNTATSNIANATVVKMKDKQNMAKYRRPIGSSSGADIASSKTVVNPNGNILATLTYDTDSSVNDSYFRNVVYYQSGLTSPRNANNIATSQGQFQFVIPQAIGVYRGDTPVRFPIITQVSVGGGNKYKYIAVKDNIDTNGNTVMFGDFWLRTTWVFTDCNYGGIVDNNGANAHALASGYETSTNTYFDTLNGSNNHYANVLVITPKSDTIYATVNNFTVNVNGSGSGSVANSSGLGIVVLNYKKYIDDINTSWSTLKSVVSTTKIQGSDVDNSKIYNYLNNVDNCNNFNPYNTSNVWANYTNCTGTLSSAVTYNTLLNSAKNALHSDDNNYKTLRSYIDTYGKYLNNDECYSAYPEYKVARETAINTIVAPSKSSSFDYNQIDASIANNLKNAYETMIASAKAHTYTNTGVLNQTNKSIDYKCLVNDADSHVDHVDASAYISSIETLISEIAKTNKYKSDVIEHAQGVLDTHGLTNNEETESNSKVYIAHGDIESTINTYTEEILTEISNMRENRDGLNDVVVNYAYEKDNEPVGTGATKNVKYGDLITDSGYTLAKDEHVAKWTIDDGESTTVLNYNPSTNINYEATKNATITCYIESEKDITDTPYTVQFIDKAGRVRAIAYANDDTEFSVDANGVKADGQLVYEGDKLPYYQINGFKIANTEYTTGKSFSVHGDTNVYTTYKVGKPITISTTNQGGDMHINDRPVIETEYAADWDEKITVREDSSTAVMFWYLNGVIAGVGNSISFRANADTVVSKKLATRFPTEDVILDGETNIGYNAQVSYFEYNQDLNRVTLVNTFVAFDGKSNCINSQVTEAGVVLSTTASDADTIAKVGKKFASTKKTDTGNQVHIAVSRTANTDFTMHALPYIVINGKTYYGNTVKTINYKA